MEKRDKELIERINARDDTAVEQLIDEYYERLVEFASYILHNDDNAQDAVQDVFRRIWEKAEKWNPKKSIEAFLFWTAKNACLDILRKKRPHENINDLKEDIQSSFDQPDEEVEKIQRYNKLHKAIDSIPEKYRLPLILFRLLDFKHKEIAEILDISIKIVEKRLEKAMQILRGEFKVDQYNIS